ncbi:MAG TPA: DNA-directed RNA polymerase subunit alpha C-terminal domain-containing protein [Bryobacteraceae bacterium]|nr:DNA-directed RNA polymerase subunit alpha C-terminal domain-containing protein [Bryobacteraceae bacterium]
MRKQRITVLRERHLRTLEDKPPCFIQEDSWRLFVAHVRDGRTIRKISRDTGLSRFKVGALLSRVDRDLELATAGERMHGQLTLDSPIEHLALSVRVRNALREAACNTVRGLLEHDFSKATRRLGPVARKEIALSLVEHGFGAPIALSVARDERISELKEELSRLRENIDNTSRHWQSRVERLQHRLQKLCPKTRLA